MLSNSEFDFYELFNKNALKRERYRIRFHNEETLEGIPWAGSMLDPRAPNATFLLEFNDTCKEILLRSVKTAEKI